MLSLLAAITFIVLCFTSKTLRAFSLETFLSNYWRSIIAVVAIVFAIFIWPTLYKDLPMKGAYLQRQNRLTGEIQSFLPGTSREWD